MDKVTKLLSMIMTMGLYYPVRIPFMLVGDSGIGKTEGLADMCRAIALAVNMRYVGEIWSGPQLQAEDASGLPVPDLEAGNTRLLPMRLGAKCIEAGAGCLAIDEFGSITNSQEAAFLNLIHGGKLGELTLDYNIALGAMMNPSDIAANGRDLSAPAANRFAWFTWELPSTMWVDFMRGGKGLTAHVQPVPRNWHEHIRWAKALIASYIQRNPEQLHNRPPPHKAGQAWQSPRSWTNAAYLLAACRSVGAGPTSDLAALAVESCVGEGAAQAFVAWVVNMNLPDPEELLADPENAHRLLPERNDQKAVAMEALAVAAQDQQNKKYRQRWEDAWKILGPVFMKWNDVGIQGAKILAKDIPNGADFPPEARMIKPILKQAGIIRDA